MLLLAARCISYPSRATWRRLIPSTSTTRSPSAQHEKNTLRATACALPQHDSDEHDQNAKAIFYEDGASVIVIPTRNY